MGEKTNAQNANTGDEGAEAEAKARKRMAEMLKKGGKSIQEIMESFGGGLSKDHSGDGNPGTVNISSRGEVIRGGGRE
jgi:uncharacterized FlaG/YvyC family protein